MSSAAPARFYTELRKPKHIPWVDVDLSAVAIAHHRMHHDSSFCMNPNPQTCVLVDDSDLEYAKEMAEVLRFLPDWQQSKAG